MEGAAEAPAPRGAPPPPPPLAPVLVLLHDSSESDDEGAAPEDTLRLGGASAPFSKARFGAESGNCEGARAVRAEPLQADSDLANGDDICGAVAVVERGVCSFVQKARRVQAAGGIGVLFVNTDDDLFVVGGEDGDEDIELPAVMVRASDGGAFLRELASGPSTVSFSFVSAWSSSSEEEDEGDGVTWGSTPTPRAVEPGAHDDVMAEIKLAGGWHSLKPVPEDLKGRSPVRQLGARDKLMLSLRSGKNLLQKVREEGQLTPRAEREARLAAQTPAPQTQRIVTAMSSRRLVTTFDSESDGEESEEWSEEDEQDEGDEVAAPAPAPASATPLPVLNAAAVRKTVWNMNDALDPETPEIEKVVLRHVEQPAPEPEPEPSPVPAPFAPKTHSMVTSSAMTDEWDDGTTPSTLASQSSLASALSRESAPTADGCIFVTLPDGRTMQAARPLAESGWADLEAQLRSAAPALTSDEAEPVVLLWPRVDGSNLRVDSAASAAELPDGAFVSLSVGGQEEPAPLPPSDSAPSPALPDPLPMSSSSPAAVPPPPTQGRPRAATTPARMHRSATGRGPASVVAGMSAADALEAALSRAAAMQTASAKQLLAVRPPGPNSHATTQRSQGVRCCAGVRRVGRYLAQQPRRGSRRRAARDPGQPRSPRGGGLRHGGAATAGGQGERSG